jgi:hypothetical protein
MPFASMRAEVDDADSTLGGVEFVDHGRGARIGVWRGARVVRSMRASREWRLREANEARAMPIRLAAADTPPSREVDKSLWSDKRIAAYAESLLAPEPAGGFC